MARASSTRWSRLSPTNLRAPSLSRATTLSSCAWLVVAGSAMVTGPVDVSVAIVTSGCLSRPEPAKRSGCYQSVQQAIEDVLPGDLPGLSHPDGGRNGSRGVGQESDGSHDPEHLEVTGASGNGVGRDVGNEEGDNQ